MAQFLGFGDGSDGAATLSGTDAPIDSSCSGTSGATSLSATNGSFAAGQIILIHQSRGTGVGAWEVNQIASYVAGTITTRIPLSNTYTDSGASQAQVLVLKQYTSVTISSTFTGKAWDGNVGGIIAFICSGKTTISSTCSATGIGFRGGNGSSSSGEAGEGTVGAQVNQRTANGNGAGGGGQGPDGGHIEGGHGGGGGGGGSNAGNAASGKNTATPGSAGNAGGSSDLVTATFGGGGGAGGAENNGGNDGTAGGIGGGLIFIFTGSIEVTGSLQANGNGTGGNALNSGIGGGGGGGGIIIKTRSSILGSSLLVSTGGVGGTSTGAFGGKGADGGNGTIRIEACSSSGSTSPSASESLGGHNYCHLKHGVL